MGLIIIPKQLQKQEWLEIQPGIVRVKLGIAYDYEDNFITYESEVI